MTVLRTYWSTLNRTVKEILQGQGDIDILMLLPVLIRTILHSQLTILLRIFIDRMITERQITSFKLVLIIL